VIAGEVSRNRHVPLREAYTSPFIYTGLTASTAARTVVRPTVYHLLAHTQFRGGGATNDEFKGQVQQKKAAALGLIEACLARHPEMCINASFASAVASVQLSAKNWKLPALSRLAIATEGNGDGCSMQ